MVNAEFFHKLRRLAESKTFLTLLNISEDQQEAQRDLEYLTRFLVYRHIEYDGKLDVEEYIDNGIIKMAEEGLLDSPAETNFLVSVR